MVVLSRMYALLSHLTDNNPIERRQLIMEGSKLANPAPLGLMGFGATTVLLNIHNAGFFPIGSLILAMGIFYGGIAQIIAGILEYKKGNTFGLTAFTSFGSFWLTLVFIIVFKDLPGNSPAFMGWYLFVWGVFTFFMWFGTFGKNRAIQFIFSQSFHSLLAPCNSGLDRQHRYRHVCGL